MLPYGIANKRSSSPSYEFICRLCAPSFGIQTQPMIKKTGNSWGEKERDKMKGRNWMRLRRYSEILRCMQAATRYNNNNSKEKKSFFRDIAIFLSLAARGIQEKRVRNENWTVRNFFLKGKENYFDFLMFRANWNVIFTNMDYNKRAFRSIHVRW